MSSSSDELRRCIVRSVSISRGGGAVLDSSPGGDGIIARSQAPRALASLKSGACRALRAVMRAAQAKITNGHFTGRAQALRTSGGAARQLVSSSA